MKKKYAWNIKEYRKQHYTGIYGTWYSMKQRCGNPNNSQFADYGGRGITYPAKWESFSGFKEDMEEGYSKGLFIDRKDNDAPYSKENCRWVNRKIQNNNKRSNIILSHEGVTLPLALWAEKLGTSFNRLRNRYYRGFPANRILSTQKFHRYGTQK